MKVTAISDLHGNLINIEPCDLLLICGDISPLDIQRDYIQMTKWIFNEFQEWIESIACNRIILTPGNHDFWFETMIKASKTKLFKNLTILVNDEELIYDDIDNKWFKIYGTPYCKPCGKWAYELKEIDLERVYNKMPNDIDILITHEASTLSEVGYTHYDDGDKTMYGCCCLTRVIDEKKPKFAICGHVHSGTHELVKCDDTYVANCSILDESYHVYYKPLTFTI